MPKSGEIVMLVEDADLTLQVLESFILVSKSVARYSWSHKYQRRWG